MSALVVLSWHGKGFPMADYYADAPEDDGDDWPTPDGYKTGSVGESMQAFRKRCACVWPDVPMELANEDED